MQSGIPHFLPLRIDVQYNELTDTPRVLARSSSVLIPENLRGEASVGDASAMVAACIYHVIGASFLNPLRVLRGSCCETHRALKKGRKLLKTGLNRTSEPIKI